MDINTVAVIKEEVACQDVENSQPKYVKYKYSIFWEEQVASKPPYLVDLATRKLGALQEKLPLRSFFFQRSPSHICKCMDYFVHVGFFVCFILKTVSPYIAQAGHKITVVPQPSECWGYRDVSLHHALDAEEFNIKGGELRIQTNLEAKATIKLVLPCCTWVSRDLPLSAEKSQTNLKLCVSNTPGLQSIKAGERVDFSTREEISSNIPKAKAKLSGGEIPSRTKPRQIVALAIFNNTVHIGSMEEWSSVRPQRCSSTSMQHSYVVVMRIFSQCVTTKAFASPPKGFPTNLSFVGFEYGQYLPVKLSQYVQQVQLTFAVSLLAVWILQLQSNWCLKALNENF